MVRRVAQTIVKYGMFRAGDRVGVAVSGGADSVALLHVLRELSPELGIVLGVVHLNHRLRGAESNADAEFTRNLAASLGLEFVVEDADVRASGGNLEQAGRRIRHEYFQRLLREGRFDKIAVGHTRTDQAETVLLRILRGAGTTGLGGIHPVVEGKMVRPLLEVDRSDVIEYLTSAGQPWREDATNRDLQFARNRLRHTVLPQLERDFNPSLTRNLAQLAEWAQDEEKFWRDHVQELAARHLTIDGPTVYFDAAAAAGLPPAVERRLVRLAIQQVRGDLRGIDFAHVEQIRRLFASGEGHGRLQVPGVDVLRSFDRVRMAPASEQTGLAARNFCVPLTVPGTYDLPHTNRRICFELRPAEASDRGYNEGAARLDWEQMPRSLWLRNWRPGDRYRPAGWGGEEKLKALFHHYKVPLWERRRWPVVASESEIVWSRGFGPAALFAPGPRTRTVLEITESERLAANPPASV